MNPPSPDPAVGVPMDALVIGFVFGLVPLFFGFSRRRADLGAVALIVCLVCGVGGGLTAAAPAAVIATVLIAVLGKRRTAAAPRGGAPSRFATSWTMPENAPAGFDPLAASLLGGGDLAVPCASCSRPIPTRGGILPPWCPSCGADVKRPAKNPEPAAPAPAGDGQA